MLSGFVSELRDSDCFWALLWRYAHALESSGHLRILVFLRSLSKVFATFILYKVYKNPGILKKDAIEEGQGSMKVKYNTLRKLIECGLIREDTQTYKHNAKPLFCTDLGEKVAEHIAAIHDMLPYKECEPDEYK